MFENRFVGIVGNSYLMDLEWYAYFVCIKDLSITWSAKCCSTHMYWTFNAQLQLFYMKYSSRIFTEKPTQLVCLPSPFLPHYSIS
jgi:hypothetical protein